jgi:3-oxoadipate enol-lactonase
MILPPLHHHLAGPAGAPWLTFIPGIGNDASFWQAQAAVLARTHRVLTFDPWGHGDSPAPPHDCSFADIVQGVVQLWDALGIQRSHLAGLGFGGSVALALGLDHPQRVDRIVAFCCRPRQPGDRRDFWRKRMQTARDTGMQALADATVDRWLGIEFRTIHPEVDAALRAMMKRTTLDGYLAYVAAFVEMDLEPRIGAMQRPVLLVAAEHDHGGGPVAAMRELAAQLRGAELSVLAGSGHICNHEAPEAVSALIESYLGRSA